jgi:glycosyltransferase involved in cell wall biosynthesis
MCKLKIAHIIEDSRFGGPQRWTSVISGKLKSLGFDQTVIFPVDNSDRFFEMLNKQRVKTHRITLHWLTKEKKRLSKFFVMFIPELISLYKFFRNREIDIVHCNNSWQFKGVIAAKFASKKIVWHLHEATTPFCVNIIFRFLAKYCVDAFIVAGERASNYYLNNKKLQKKPVLVVQSPVDVSVFHPEKVEENRRINNCFGLKIVTVGNVNYDKGLEYFVKMASILNKKYNGLSFFIVGPHIDSQRVYLKKVFDLVKQYNLKNLYFYGQSENIPSVLKVADIYVCSSVTEASPTSVWEAMSMQKAIVSTDVGDVGNFIKDGKSGYVVPVKDAVAIAKKVGLFVENAELRQKVGINARKIALRNLDVDICVKKYADFYREIINTH